MKSILMIGLGRFGRHMTEKLLDEGNDVLGIDKSEDRADKCTDILRDIQIGDATDEHFMESLGINNFDICVVAIGDNFQASLEITVILKDLGAKFIIARANRDVHKKLLLRNGADYVVYAERDMAEKLAVKFGAKNIFDYIELTPEVAIYEIAVPTSWHGKSILEQNVRARYNVSILAVKTDGRINPVPDPKYRFTGSETLMVMGSNADVRALTKK